MKHAELSANSEAVTASFSSTGDLLDAVKKWCIGLYAEHGTVNFSCGDWRKSADGKYFEIESRCNGAVFLGRLHIASVIPRGMTVH